MAGSHPARRVEVIVQLDRGTNPRVGKELISAVGGHVTGDLHVINGLAARMTAAKAETLASYPGVRAVSLNSTVKKNSIDDSKLATSYDASLKAPHAWSKGATGKGVGVAVIDTGVAGDQPDFRESQTDRPLGSWRRRRSTRARRMTPTRTATARTWPGSSPATATTAARRTHCTATTSAWPRREPGLGQGPDDEGDATVLDVIYGLQFVVDHKDDYNIRVVNLSLESTETPSLTRPTRSTPPRRRHGSTASSSSPLRATVARTATPSSTRLATTRT